MQAPFAMLPVLQPAFLLATLELADSDVIGHARDRNLQPIKQFSEHGYSPPGSNPYTQRAAAAFFLVFTAYC